MNAKATAIVIVLAVIGAGGAVFMLGGHDDTVKYTVSFDTDGGSAPAPDDLTVEKEAYITLPLYSGTKEGYTFCGWLDGSTPYRTDTEYKVTGNVTLRADWVPPVSVTYDTNGGSEPAPAAFTCNPLETIITAAYAGTKEGCTFLGWDDGTERVGADSVYALGRDSVTFTAVYTSDIRIEFLLSGGTGEVPGRPAVAGTQFTVPACTAARTGYDFSGWNDGTSTVAAGSSYDLVLSDITFRAVWTAHTYSVNFILNGGTNPEDAVSSFTYPNGLNLPIPTKEGCVFLGWYLENTFVNEQRNIQHSSCHDYTLYACWETSEVGTGMTMDFSGTIVTTNIREMPIRSGTQTGSIKQDLIFFEYPSGYWVSNSSVITTTYAGNVPVTETDENDYWNSSSGMEWTVGEDTVNVETRYYGTKECYVYTGRLSNAIQINYVGTSDGLTYKIDLNETVNGFDIYYGITHTYIHREYDLTSSYTFDADSYYKFDIYEDLGVSVSGDEHRVTGDRVTLRAIPAAGTAFSGWYDENGRLMSQSAEYTLPDRLLKDIVLYARSTAAYDDRMTVSTGGTDYALKYNGTQTGLEWTVTYVTEETAGSGPAYHVPKAGTYKVNVSGTDASGNRVLTSYNLLADGYYSYTWDYNGPRTVSLNIIADDYLTYRNNSTARYSGTDAHMKAFVTWDNPYIECLAQQFREMTIGMSDRDRLSLVLSYTQDIEYMYDSDFIRMSEYWKFPLETVFDGCGDCEDTAILYCAIIKQMGYDTALMTMYASMTENDPGAAENHCASLITGIEGCGSENQYACSGRTYYFCETTARGSEAGHDPWTTVNRTHIVPI